MAALRRVYELPYPPSVNHYWRRVGFRTLISREGRRFRARVVRLLALQPGHPAAGRLSVRVTLYPPDARRRDLDNAPKALLDALGHAGAYHDDGQIDELIILRGDVVPGGRAVVEIAELDGHGAASVST